MCLFPGKFSYERDLLVKNDSVRQDANDRLRHSQGTAQSYWIPSFRQNYWTPTESHPTHIGTPGNPNKSSTNAALDSELFIRKLSTADINKESSFLTTAPIEPMRILL
jgi:hypothetical protein